MATIANITYSSSIDSISNLSARIAYPAASNLPVVVLMHGIAGDATSFDDATLTRIANYGMFVVSVGMRGRNGAGGSPDCGGREIHDIYDAVQHVRAAYPSIVSVDKAAAVGYSGGGGNVLACATKFPDFFTDYVSHFGISDYGDDATFGWYEEAESTYQAMLESWIGGTPTAVPDAYNARDARLAAKNILGGHLYLFHDVDDTIVPIDQSQRVASAMTAAGLSNYAANYSSSSSTYRWLHGYPTAGSSLAHTEDTWAPVVTGNTHAIWTYPTTGTIRVNGYIKTKRFTIWLGDGRSESATVTFNASAGTYDITPLTGSMDVTVSDGITTVSASISSVTQLSIMPAASITVAPAMTPANAVGVVTAEPMTVTPAMTQAEAVQGAIPVSADNVTITPTMTTAEAVLVGAGSIRSPSGRTIDRRRLDLTPITIRRHLNGTWQ